MFCRRKKTSCRLLLIVALRSCMQTAFKHWHLKQSFRSVDALGCCRTTDSTATWHDTALSAGSPRGPWRHSPLGRGYGYLTVSSRHLLLFSGTSPFARWNSTDESREKSGICKADEYLQKRKELIISGHKSSRSDLFPDFEVGVIGLPAKDLLSKRQPSLTSAGALAHALLLFLYHRSVGSR